MYNDVRCVTKTAAILVKISNLYFIFVAVLLLHKKENILYIQLIEVSQRHSKGIAIKKNSSSVYFGHICVGIFQGNVTEVTQRNYLNSMSDIEVEMKVFHTCEEAVILFYTRITFHAFCITLFKNVQLQHGQIKNNYGVSQAHCVLHFLYLNIFRAIFMH